jgi:hypothetical protein
VALIPGKGACSAVTIVKVQKRLFIMTKQLRRKSTHTAAVGSDKIADKLMPTSGQRPRYIAYPKAMQLLSDRLSAAPAELAAWVFFGPESGGIAAYLNANELDPPPRFGYGMVDPTAADLDYLLPLSACWFDQAELSAFMPGGRYITGQGLIDRWAGNRWVQTPADFIQIKVAESRLRDMHPIRGMTQGSIPGDTSLPQITDALFLLENVQQIEQEDFGPSDISCDPGHESRSAGVAKALAVAKSPAECDPTHGSKAKDIRTLEDSSRPIQDYPKIPTDPKSPEIGSAEWRSATARKAANAKHDRPGGSREKQRKIQEIWASGKYSRKDICAEQESAELNWSFGTARRALQGLPDPKPTRK